MEIFIIIYCRVQELFAERLKTFSIEDYTAKWDELRAQVDSALEILKAIGSKSAEANIEEIYAWYVDVLNQMDMVELRHNSIK